MQGNTEKAEAGRPNPTLRLEAALSTAAAALADLTPDCTTWHAWAEYFLFCLEAAARYDPGGPAGFEAELELLEQAIHNRRSRGDWSSTRRR